VAVMEVAEDMAVAVTEVAVEDMEEAATEVVEDMEAAVATNSINAVVVGFVTSLASQPIRYCFYVLFTNLCSFEVPSSSETHF
jgi:vacuolar-type H+-ATPase subunit D/Vma8